MSILSFMFFFFSLSFAEIQPGANNYKAYNPSEYDVCQTKYTMQHYLQGRCVEVQKAESKNSNETFKLRSVIISDDLSQFEQRQTIILIPGGPGESSGLLRYGLNIKDTLNAFAQHLKLNVVLYDPRGTGSSQLHLPPEKLSSKEFNTAIMIDDLKSVADEISPNKPVLLFAHSSGGSVALRYAQSHPERVSKIILSSASVSPREMMKINLQKYVFKTNLWENFVAENTLDNKLKNDLQEKFLYIEQVLIQQFKARVLKLDVNTALNLSPLTFRESFIVAAQSKDAIKDVTDLINTIFDKLENIKKDHGPLVTEALLMAKVKAEPEVESRFKNGEWIKAQIVCGEGLTKEEALTPSFIDGLNIAWFCNDKFTAEEELVDIDLSTIKTPVLYFAGEKDFVVPLKEAQYITNTLPNATQITDENSGHMFFVDAAVKFYFSIEKFLN